MNRWLEGNYAPVERELTATDLRVEGELPRELAGRLVRNGPNPIDPDPARYHWFFGDGMIHGVELAGGKAVEFRNRWVRTDKMCKKLGETPPADQPPDCSFLGSAANTNIVFHAGRLLALEEASLPVELDSELSTIGRVDFAGKLSSAFTAHPKIDPHTNEMFAFGYGIAPPFLRLHVIDAEGNLARSEPVELPRPVMIHDFAITESRIVFMDLPVCFDLESVQRGGFPFVWKPEHGARVGVMPRAGSTAELRWFDVEPCYVYHPLNAYDDGDRVVLDVVRHADMFATAEGKHGPDSSGPPTLDRWTIDLSTETVSEQRICETAGEFPRCDDRLVGRKHRFGYRGVRAGFEKVDLETGKTWVHALPTGGLCEGVFVPASESAGEDEGWLLSFVPNTKRDAADLVVIDAQSFSSAPVAVVELPQRVPFGFHGNWVPA